MKKLSSNLNEKKDVIRSESNLHDFVEFLENLTTEQQEKIKNSPVNYFIPWRSVWNMNSISTSCRLVYDASQTTSTGVSLKSPCKRPKQHEQTCRIGHKMANQKACVP